MYYLANVQIPVKIMFDILMQNRPTKFFPDILFLLQNSKSGIYPSKVLIFDILKLRKYEIPEYRKWIFSWIQSTVGWVLPGRVCIQ